MNTIESLKELYVKLGGSLEYVENKTTIPEMIDAITEVAGGSEPTYETVAEIPVGTMVENHGLYVFQLSDRIPLAKNETLFFNSEEYPLQYDEKGTAYYYNLDVSTGAATGTPAYAVSIDGSYINGLISDTPDLSNTTVRILKKVEQGGGDIPENLKPTYEFGFEMTADGQGNFTVTADEGVTFAALKSALAETPLVFAMVRYGGQLSRIQIQSDRESKIETTAIFYAGNNTFLALDISIAADDTITTTAKTLT